MYRWKCCKFKHENIIRLVNNLINKEIIHGEENFFHRGTLQEIPSEQNRPILATSGAYLGEGCRGSARPPPEMTCGFLIQLVFCIKSCLHHQSVTPLLRGGPPLKKNPGYDPAFAQ